MGLSDDVKNIFSMAKELIENAAEDEGVKIKLEVAAEEKESESFDDISDKLDELDGKLGDLEIEVGELLDCIDIWLMRLKAITRRMKLFKTGEISFLIKSRALKRAWRVLLQS